MCLRSPKSLVQSTLEFDPSLFAPTSSRSHQSLAENWKQQGRRRGCSMPRTVAQLDKQDEQVLEIHYEESVQRKDIHQQ